MGHAGTLDPMASGILIIGIGRGTKSLINFLDSTKTYETVVLFGKSTDTYDITGKIVNEDEFGGSNVTREMVQSKFSAFRGTIRQVPPVYSALKVGGRKALELAKEGKEVELESREMRVEECDMVEWLEAGQHSYRWPSIEGKEEGDEARHASSPAARIRLTVSSGSTSAVLRTI